MKETVIQARCDICHNVILDLNGHTINIKGLTFDVCGLCAPAFSRVVQFLIIDAGIFIDYEYIDQRTPSHIVSAAIIGGYDDKH